MIKKLFWKYRYARCMQKQSGCKFSFGWDSAEAWIEFFDWLDEDPTDCAFTEMSYWSD